MAVGVVEVGAAAAVVMVDLLREPAVRVRPVRQAELGQAPTTPRPLPAAPIWTRPPMTVLLDAGSGAPSITGEYGAPSPDAQIAEFCRTTYGVDFPMFSKITVKGEGKHPLYQELTGMPAPIGGEVAWNFQKYLVDRKGTVVAKFDPRTAPDDAALVGQIEELLAKQG